MTNDEQAGSSAQDEQREQTKLALGTMLIPLFFAIGFAVCIIGAYHKPHPNHIKFGVVGPPALTAPLRAGLQKAAGGAFEVSSVATPAQAAHDVSRRDLEAAFVPTPDPRRPATVIVATGGGRLVSVAAETLARAVTDRQGAVLVVKDVRPVVPDDAIGIGVFLFMIVCTICGYFAAMLLFTEAPTLSAGRRYAIIAGVAVVVPIVVYLIGGLGWGTYRGSFGTIVAFIAVGALYVFVIGMITRLLQILIGPLALFVALAIFIFLNIPSLGATFTDTMLPPFWRFFNHFWIGAETTNAERSILYFGGQGVGWDLLRLLAWGLVVLALLLLPVSRKLARERERKAAAGEQEPRPTNDPRGEASFPVSTTT